MSSPSWSERLFGGFRKTSERLAANLDVVGTARLDEATLDDVEDALILSDLGPTAARRIRERLREKRFGLEISQRELQELGIAITIAPGDTVTWTWVSGSHSIVSGPGCTADGGFDSGLSSTPGTTFTSPVGFYDTTGAYPYFCGFGSHCSVLNMKGTVTVEGPPPTPKVPSMGTVALLATALLMGILTIWMGRVRSRRACDEVRPARQP